MTLPNQTANQSALRADGHQMHVYLTPMLGEVVLSATISTAPAAANVFNLAVTTVSGSYTAVRRGMRVVIETPGGAYKGTLTVRHAGTLSATNLPVREFSRGHIEIASGDVVNVYNDFQLVDRLVKASEEFEPDGEVYTNQNSLIAPVGASGGAWAGNVDDDETYATIQLPGPGYTVDPDSAGTVTYLTTLPTGVAFAPGSADTDASPMIRADVGYHVIERQFTDASNSKTETQYVCIRVHDENDPPLDLADELTINGERKRGWTISGVQMFGDTTLANLPDRCPVIVWCVEIINGTVQSFGMKAANRSHILCTGYLRRDTGKIDGQGNEIQFDIVSPLGRLSELPGFSKVMIREASPDVWSELQGLTVKRAIIQLLRYYTNAVQLFDLVFDGFADADYSRLYLQKQVPLEQVGELADSRDAMMNADATGRMEIQHALEYTPLDDRVSVTQTLTLGLDDVIIDPQEGIGVEIIRDHDRPLEIFQARGFSAGTEVNDNQPLFGKWAASPGTGTLSSSVDRVIADDAASFFATTAMRGAWEDRVFIDANDDNKQYHAPEVRVTLPGSYRGLFQFYREHVLLDLDETTNPRGVDLTVFLFIVTNVELQIRGGTARVVLTLRAATYAEGAVDDTPPASSLPPSTDPGAYDPPLNPNPTTPILRANSKRIGVLTSDGELLRTVDFDTPEIAGGPYYTRDQSFGAVTLMAMAQKIGEASTIFTVDKDFIYKVTGITDIDSPITVNDVLAFSSAPTGVLRIIDTERNDRTWMCCISYDDSIGTYCNNSYDGGDTWSGDILITANASDSPAQHQPTLYMSQDVPGLAFTTAFNGSGVPQLYKTTDRGATWSPASDYSFSSLKRTGLPILSPFADRTKLYFNRATLSGFTYLYDAYRATEAGNVDISPSFGGNTYGFASGGIRPLAVVDGLANYAVALMRFSNQSSLVGIARTYALGSMANGAGWEWMADPDAANFAKFCNVEVTSDLSVFISGTAKIFFTPFNNWRLDDRSGNMGSLGTTGVGLRPFGF